MRITTKLLAVGAAAALATSGLLAATISPAVAAPTMKLSPTGPFEDGDKVKVTLSGFTPNAPVAVGLIPASRFPAEGPGDACAGKLGCSKLLVADASGGLTADLVIVEGPIENSKAPAESCGPDDPCVMGAANINNPSETVKVDIKYVEAAAPAEPAEPAETNTSSGGESASNPDSGSGSDTAADSGTLPQTGPRETAIAALLGLAAFQVGLILAVRSMRKTPRRISA
jgi:hypothetical protein